MPRRRVLKNNLTIAWTRCIESDYEGKYCLRRINSERSLQAAYWAYLIQVLPKTQKIFIEPAIQVGGNVLYPDLVVCNSREIIGIVELKYTPRSPRARVRKDIGTMCKLAKHQGEVAVVNHRYWGQAKHIKPYRMSSHIVFCWAGVHREPLGSAKQTFVEFLNCLGGVGEHSILQLHAVTKKEGKPRLFPIEDE